MQTPLNLLVIVIIQLASLLLQVLLEGDLHLGSLHGFLHLLQSFDLLVELPVYLVKALFDSFALLHVGALEGVVSVGVADRQGFIREHYHRDVRKQQSSCMSQLLFRLNMLE